MVICAVVGSRSFRDYAKMTEILDGLKPTMIQTGDAMGADDLAIRYAESHSIPYRSFAAEWSKYGKSAGIRRNADIIEGVDKVVAFWDGESPGTRNTIERCQESSTLKDNLIIETFTPPPPPEPTNAPLELDDSTPNRLMIRGKSIYPIRFRLKDMGAKWDIHGKQWVLNVRSQDELEKRKTEISELVEEERARKSYKRSLVAQDAWEVRKKQETDRLAYEESRKPDFKPENPEVLSSRRYADRLNLYEVLMGPADMCERYVQHFQKEYDVIFYNTKVEKISDTKYHLTRWKEGRD